MRMAGFFVGDSFSVVDKSRITRVHKCCCGIRSKSSITNYKPCTLLVVSRNDKILSWIFRVLFKNSFEAKNREISNEDS